MDRRQVLESESDCDAAAYGKWARRKIEHALKQADAHPDKRIPQAEVWRRFGIEDLP
jgi:hypothetical protein